MSQNVDGDGDPEGDAMSLLRLAGARPRPSPEAVAAARAHVRAAWRAGVRRRRARAGFALAAGLAAAVATALLVGGRGAGERVGVGEPPGPRAVVVGSLGAATGLVERETPSGWTSIVVGEAVVAGSRLRTVAGGAGLRAPGGRSVRLGPASRLRWETPGQLALEAGTVYLDSGGRARPGAAFEVRTSWGTLRETGTQYEVHLDGAGLRVRVREGRVALVTGTPDASEAPGAGPGALPEEVAAGNELRVGDRGVERRRFPAHGPEWSWVLTLAPAFEMDGRSLHDLASWAAREAGWELHYSDAESERRSQQAVLRGSVRGLRPDEAALAAVPSTGLAHRVGDGVLRIGPAGSAERAR
jgi:hypothetical protein